MTRSNAMPAISAAALAALALGGGASAAPASVFMGQPEASKLVLQTAPASDARKGPAAPAVLGLGQPDLGVRPEVLALTGVSSEAAARLKLSDAFYRQGLVIAPGPGGGAEGAVAPGLINLAALQALSGAPLRTCAFECMGATVRGEWLEAAPRPLL